MAKRIVACTITDRGNVGQHMLERCASHLPQASGSTNSRVHTAPAEARDAREPDVEDADGDDRVSSPGP
jgi:hypothetical protein